MSEVTQNSAPFVISIFASLRYFAIAQKPPESAPVDLKSPLQLGAANATEAPDISSIAAITIIFIFDLRTSLSTSRFLAFSAAGGLFQSHQR